MGPKGDLQSLREWGVTNQGVLQDVPLQSCFFGALAYVRGSF